MKTNMIKYNFINYGGIQMKCHVLEYLGKTKSTKLTKKSGQKHETDPLKGLQRYLDKHGTAKEIDVEIAANRIVLMSIDGKELGFQTQSNLLKSLNLSVYDQKPICSGSLEFCKGSVKEGSIRMLKKHVSVGTDGVLILVDKTKVEEETEQPKDDEKPLEETVDPAVVAEIAKMVSKPVETVEKPNTKKRGRPKKVK